MDDKEKTLTLYDQFAERIFSAFKGKRAPIQGGIDITSRCNLRCAHCYIQGTSPKEEHELTYDEIRRIFDQIADEGCVWMFITGGEPLLRPDFIDIYRYAKRKGFLITLFTNGTLLTPEIADLLQAEKPFKIEISLYGMTAATYERVTGVPGSFARCLHGIDLLIERKLPLQLKSVALTLNKHEVRDMQQYAEKLGVDFRFDPMINNRLDGSTMPANVRLSPPEILELDLADEVRACSWRKLCDSHWQAAGDDRLYVCGAGINIFHVTAAGDLAECVIGRQTNYNLLQGTFHEGFYEAIPSRVLAQRRTRFSECQSCPMISLCSNCPSWAELECGDPEARVDWLCQVAHLRAAAFKKGWREETAVKQM
jgi:radical SAM protein with 4Fe4S-binding SPASM domain